MTKVMHEDWRNAGFGLYIHWPFCTSKCPYCDFNSHVAAKIDQSRWLAAYLSEIDRAGAQTSDRILNSIFIGGGTPSLMPAETVSAILSRVRATWRVVNDLEITMEANPGSADEGRFAAYAIAGVNRLSLGVQSLEDNALRKLGRLHSAADAIRAVRMAQSIFPRVSIDLMYARQGQDMMAWAAELDQSLHLGTTHISLYQLTIEDGTTFAQRHAKGLLRGLPDDDLATDLFEMTREACARAGFEHYEVSNFAQPGNASVHNMIYWQSGDFIGIGPGAHGRVTLDGIRYATEAARNPAAWLTRSEGGLGGETLRDELSAEDHADELVLMGLRVARGISLGRLERINGMRPSADSIATLRADGLIEVESDILRATPRGLLVLNHIIVQLAAGMVRSRCNQ